MMKAFPLLLLIGLLAVGVQCKKDTAEPTEPREIMPADSTTLQLRVVDINTGTPLAGAVCAITGSGVGNDYFARLDTLTTDANGFLEITFASYYTKVYYYVELTGYVSQINKPVFMDPGKVNEYMIKLRPFDAAVRLEVENLKDEPAYFFFNQISGSTALDAENLSFVPFQSPLLMQPFEKFTATIPALADDAVSIFWTWDFKDLNPGPPFKNVVIIPVGDTLLYKVTN